MWLEKQFRQGAGSQETQQKPAGKGFLGLEYCKWSMLCKYGHAPAGDNLVEVETIFRCTQGFAPVMSPLPTWSSILAQLRCVQTAEFLAELCMYGLSAALPLLYSFINSVLWRQAF